MVSVEDVKLYYSGGVEHEQFQGNPLVSLGGFRSGVRIPNGSYDTIFDEVGLIEMQGGQKIYRCIYFKNEHATDAVTNLDLYITGKQSFETIKFGVSSPADNTSGVQLLNSQYDMPYNVTFYEAYVIEDKVELIASLAAGQVIVIWLSREIPEGTTERSVESELNFEFDWT